MKILDTILGKRLNSNEQEGVKIGVMAGVPAMGLDGLSSAAYGPEATLTVLLPLGVLGLHYILPLTLIIIGLLTLLYFSYRQTVTAYPTGGGSFTVATENLGTWPGLLAAAALMVDYLLNVAVGISAGIAALVSAAPQLHHWTLPMCLGVLAVITVLNLRGTGEAGLVFALPTYLFIISLAAIIVMGVIHTIAAGGHPTAMATPPKIAPATEAFSIWLLLRAFASGCTAMTGVEAVSNGVGAFKEPTVKRAHATLTIIVATLAILLVGVAFLAHVYQIDSMRQDKPGYQSILSQLIGAIAGRGWLYYVTIGSVLVVLCLSANTSFVGFPRLCRLIAKSDYLPRSFAMIGRRLVYSVGVIVLAIAAAGLLILFDGITDRLIPLFAVGAFLAFTLSQAGMVMHLKRELQNNGGTKGTKFKLAVNAIGGAATGIAVVIILAAKFTEGAWIVCLVIPLLLILFKFVHSEYEKFDQQTTGPARLKLDQSHRPVVVVPTRGSDQLTAKALRFAMWLSSDVLALHLSNLSGDEAKEEDRRVRINWIEQVENPAKEQGQAVPRLEFVAAPFRSLLEPLFEKIDELKKQHPNCTIAIVIPEVVSTHWWQSLLHARKSSRLRRELLNRGDHRIVVIEVPWYLFK